MNKKTFHYLVEAGWLFLALLPLFLYLVLARSAGSDLATFMSMMADKLDFVSSENVIFTTIKGVFGSDGMFPILHDGMILYLTYFCIVELVHLLVDVLVFIPRVAHGWLDSFTRRI